METNKHRALIVVDVQNDFMEGGALEVPKASEIIHKINTLLEKYELVIFTRDFHPANHKSFASQHEGKQPFEQIVLNGLDQVLWPDHCIQETFGSMIHKDIDMSKMTKNCKMYIFKKGMDSEVDSYSAFYDNGRKNSTGLSEFLKERNIKQCDFVGLALDYCVMWSAEDAVKKGFESSIIIEATKAIDPNFNVAQLSKKGIKIIL